MAIPAWNWLRGVYQAPVINEEEMDSSEIAFIFFQDTQELIYTLWSATFQKAGEYCPKVKKLRAGISPRLLVAVHKVSFHLVFFFQMISAMPVMLLLCQKAQLY